MTNQAAQLRILSQPDAKQRVEEVWQALALEFESHYAAMPTKPMARTELTFHPYVKLLGYLCLDLAQVPGDVLEIGVWKGRSLALMDRLSPGGTQVIGVDPCALQGQQEELRYFHTRLFPDVKLVVDYSERAAPAVLTASRALKLVHIDGGHLRYNVWADFLLYAPFVVPGGYVVFDDYDDPVHSADVGPAVDEMKELGLFSEFEIIGPLAGYTNSYLLRRPARAQNEDP